MKRALWFVGLAVVCCTASTGVRPDSAHAAMSVTVSCDPQTVVPGDDAYLNFTAVVSGTPDPLGECTAENESWVWLDGTTGQSDIIDYTVPSDTTATTITVPDSVTVSYTSSCDGSAGSAIGAGSATFNVDLSTCG